MSMTAKDIMVTRLVTLSPAMDVFEAIKLLIKKKISGAPVIDEEKNFLGVFSERNCMTVLIDAAHDQLPGSEVGAFIDRDVKVVEEETGILSIAQIFHTTHHRRVPVLRDGKLVGQISRRDVIRAALDLIAVAPDKETSILYLSALCEREDAPVR